MSTNAVVVVADDDEGRPFSERETRRLAELQKVIEQDFQAFYRVGLALSEIKASKLYRLTHKGNFEGFCKQYFDLAKSRTNELIRAAEVYDNLLLTVGGEQTEAETSATGGSFDEQGTEIPALMGVLPKNERQIRPLTRLRPDQQRQVWQAVLEATPIDKKPSASAINKAVKEYLGDKVNAGIKKAREQATENLSANEQFKAAFDVYLTHIIEAQAEGYTTISRTAIIDTLDAVRALLAVDGDLLGESVIESSRDAIKLEKAGYRLFRMEPTSMTIKTRDGGGWPKHSGPFASKTALQEAFTALLQFDMHLAG